MCFQSRMLSSVWVERSTRLPAFTLATDLMLAACDRETANRCCPHRDSHEFPASVAHCLCHPQSLGSKLLRAGQPENAYTAFWKLAMVGSQRNQPRWVGAAQGNLGACASMVGDKHRASWHFEQEALFARQLGDKVWEGRARYKLASSLRAWALTVASPPVAIEGMARADVEFALSLQLAVEGQDSIGVARARCRITLHTKFKTLNALDS